MLQISLISAPSDSSPHQNAASVDSLAYLENSVCKRFECLSLLCSLATGLWPWITHHNLGEIEDDLTNALKVAQSRLEQPSKSSGAVAFSPQTYGFRPYRSRDESLRSQQQKPVFQGAEPVAHAENLSSPLTNKPADSLSLLKQLLALLYPESLQKWISALRPGCQEK